MNYTVSSDSLEAVISEKGAELTSLIFNGVELIWQGKKGFWPGKAPLLFPVCGFLKGGSYFHEDKEYQMDVHGFAKDSKFTLIEKSDHSISFQLTETKESLKQYPFKFSLMVTYILKGPNLSIDWKVGNPAESILPFSIGWHPGFNCTSPASLELIGDFEKREVTEAGLIGNSRHLHLREKQDLTPDFFESGGIVLMKNDENVALETESYSLYMSSSDFPAIILWGQPGADFICLEPWHGMGDTVDHNSRFTEKENLVFLNQGEEFKRRIILKVQ